ncbi:MAG: S8 family peptidase [Treponema sp.]
MKNIYLICLLSLAFSCAVVSYEKDEISSLSMQEKAFLGYDLDKVNDASINIKVKASNNEEMDAFVASLKNLDVVEKTRMEGFQKGEMYLTVRANGNYPETLKKIRELTSIFYAEPDYKVNIIGSYVARPSTPIFHPFGLTEGNLNDDPVGDLKEYALEITEALRAYEEFGYGKHTVWAGIIDTGTNANHEDLKDQNGKRVVKVLKTAFGPLNKIVDVPSWNSEDEVDAIGHGTHCTGSICAVGNNGKGIAGVAWKNVKFASYKAMTKSGGSMEGIYGSLKDLVDTVRSKVSRQDQATIPVNLSLGAPTVSVFAIEALNYAISKGFLPVASNGNDGQFFISYPTAYPGVLSVGASGDDDKKAGFSTYGSWLNVVAPGLNIISLKHSSQNDYLYMSGTSMAAPFVTGMIAYLLSFNPTLTPFQIMTILEKSTDKIDALNEDPVGKYDEKGFSNWYGYGRVNVYKATKMVVEGNVPARGKEYVETTLKVSTTYSNQFVYVYDKKTGVLVAMSATYGYPANTEIKGLRPGLYNVVCSGSVRTVTIGNDRDVTIAF